MPLKTKLPLLIGLGLLTIILNVLVLLPAYQVNLQIEGSTPELTPLIQAITWISQTKKLEFGGIPTIRPKTTPSPSVWQVQILNGSGIAGAGADLKEKVETIDGLTVASVDNTESTTTTLIQLKTKIPSSIRTQLTALVKQDFTGLTQESLTDDAAYDAIIILGSQP